VKITREAIAKTVFGLLETEARKATYYLSADTVVTATRRFKPDKRQKTTDVVLKLGKPNSRERDFVKKCQKAGEPFPVKKLQLKFWKK
jgi:hypothetical protein